MKTEEAKALLEKYYAGKTSVQEEAKLAEYLNSSEIPQELEHAKAEFAFYHRIAKQQFPARLDPILKQEIRNDTGSGGKSISMISIRNIAAAVLLLVLGFTGGRMSESKSAEQSEITALKSEVASIKQIMTLSLLEQSSVHDRLKAVAMASDLEVNQEIIAALINAMNNDNNINIRLASIEALSRFLDQEEVVHSMLRALSQQESVPIKLELARIMIASKEKASLPILQEILKNDSLDSQVKDDIAKGIEIINSSI